jgi:hypothetical protein
LKIRDSVNFTFSEDSLLSIEFMTGLFVDENPGPTESWLYARANAH